ncbi:hypothetical protein CXF85_01690 [Colwellia sp. 75C3]|uniref:TapY2 family type IVa secretion system protein n=1 Tax=Colwellia sp. 75C3 TaxID=888425 RepID=UPI000C33AAA5|nr:TapY2 family type IVa secretion system protein [Colwellia sp. 75C3]PKG86440.1 hypothetical protein CXF85_01690 [Colwellia sp. 75C3]
MNNFIISICCVLTLSVFSAHAALSNEGGDKKNIDKGKKVTAKCHVVLVGGNETIIFHRIKPEKLSLLTNSIVGKKVSTQKSPDKIKVYRAFECVLDKEKFTSIKARSLDRMTPR